MSVTSSWAEPSSAQCGPALSAAIPPRPSSAREGVGLLYQLRALSDSARDDAIRGELLAGNLPKFLRELVPIRLGSASGRDARVVTVCVLPDYLAVGSEHDHVVVSMGLGGAVDVARRFGFLLPTRKIVDAIHRHAVRLTPQPLPPGASMRSIEYLLQHHRLISTQRRDVAPTNHHLIAGHKKDLVLSGLLWSQPERVAIYGWHHPNGRPIQPLSIVHGAGYADYSHGVRLVSATAYVDGQPRAITDLLRDPTLAHILADEGVSGRLPELFESIAARSRTHRS